MDCKKIFLVWLAAVLVQQAWGQARIGLNGTPKVQAVQPTERPVASPYTAEDSARYRRLIQTAYHALQNDSFSVGKSRLEQALKVLPKMPSNVEVYYELGQLEEREGRQRSALDLYGKAIKFNGSYAKPYLRRGGLYLLLGQAADAVADFDKVLHLSPKDEDALFFRACAHADMGHVAAAAADFGALLALHPLDERASYGMALLDVQQKNWQQALQRMDALIGRHPNDSRYYAKRADIEEALGQEAAAAADWAHATDLSPKDAALLKGHALFLARQGRREEALTLLGRGQRMGVPYEDVELLRTAVRRQKRMQKTTVGKK
ncbi:MAG: tetratricopeptide repeat protein [Bacteroidaceae bacterium]|nr:tetratricopeptide repeat protein [Bacteroidaceae bacterium]